jgi:NDP-sugar pyrophosphorylase family protein
LGGTASLVRIFIFSQKARSRYFSTTAATEQILMNFFFPGKNVVIENAYIWDNVVIGDNCKIVQSIVADDVILKSNVSVEKGCLISFKVSSLPALRMGFFDSFS